MPSKDLIFRLLGEDVTASSSMTKLAASGEATSRKIKDSFGPLPGYIALAGVAVAGVSIKMASDFQSQMTLLQTAAGESKSNMTTVSDGILAIASATGTSSTQLAEGMYTIEKAGIRGSDGLKVLKAAAEGAKAENVDLGTATNALTSVMMSYHMKASQAVQVQNMLVAGSGMAKTTMQEYAGSLAAVIPVASAAGIGFDQVGGAIATLTQHGTSAQEATQELANTIRGLQAPSHESASMMQQLGLNVTDVSSNLGKRGLTGTIDLITQAIASKMGPAGLVVADSFKQSKSAAADAQIELSKMPKSLQAVAQSYLAGTVSGKQWRKDLMGMTVDQRQLAQQFAQTVNRSRGFNDMLHSGSPAAMTFAGTLNKVMGGATGMNTALMLGGENMAYFKKATEDVGAAGKKSGSDISTWAQTQATLKVQMDQLGSSVQVIAIKIGTALMPTFQAIVHATMGFTTALTGNKTLLITVMSILGGLAAVMGAVYVAQKLFAAGAAIIRAASIAATVAQWAWNVAMDANPIGIIILAVAALVAGLIWFFTQTKLGQDIWSGFVKFLGDAWNWLWNSVLKPTFDLIGAVFTWLWNSIVMPYINLIVLEVKILGAIFSWLWQNVISPVATWIGNAIGVVGSVIGAVFGGIGNVVRGAFNGVVDFVRGIFNGIIDMVNGVIGAINGIGSAIAAIPGAPKIHIGTLPHLATGGTMTHGGMALVGENGPEVVKLPPGATVYPHGGMPAGQNNSGGLTVQVTVQAGAVGNEQYLAKTISDALINTIRGGSINRQELRTALGV